MSFVQRIGINDIPVGRKLALLFMVGILIPLGVSNWFFFSDLIESAQRQEEDYLRSAAASVATALQREIEPILALSDSIYQDFTIYQLLDREYEGMRDYVDAHRGYLRPALDKYLAVYSAIDDILIYSTNPVVQVSAGYMSIDQHVITSYWHDALSRAPSGGMLVNHVEWDPRTDTESAQFLSLVRNLDHHKAFVTHRKILRIDLDRGALMRLLSFPFVRGTLQLLNPQGEAVISGQLGGSADDGNYSFQLPISRSGVLDGWVLSGLITAAGRPIGSGIDVRRFFVIGAIDILVVALFTVLVAYSITSRLRILSRHMRRVEKQEFLPVPLAESGDEIGQLVKDYNLMTDRIDRLINEVYTAELNQNRLLLEQKHAELHALQSQMNPHFLYNTLESIRMKAVIRGERETADVIKKLSRAFRRLVSWGDGLIPVREEIEFTSEYLEIQKYRFDERLSFKIEVDDCLLEKGVPRMIVQALVENACHHGLEPSSEPGLVSVHAAADDGYMTIEVTDNGVGIEDPAGLEDRPVEDRRMVGLQNIRSRLDLRYGDDFVFELAPGADGGTRAHIRIPAQAVS